MNFFSHFLVDSIADNPTYNAALIAPDLFRHFLPSQNRFDWKNLIHQSQFQSPEIQNFCSGSLQHLRRDSVFHQSSFFQNIYQSHRANWEELHQTQGVQRWWFTLHVAIELITDKLLIENNLNELYKFYNTLNTEFKTYLYFLELVHHPQLETFSNRFKRFTESQYLFHYQSMQGVLYAISKIHESLKIPTPWFVEGSNTSMILELQKIESTITKVTKSQNLLQHLKSMPA